MSNKIIRTLAVAVILSGLFLSTSAVKAEDIIIDPTPYWTEVSAGSVAIDGVLAPAGTVVDFVTDCNVIAGRATLTEEGVLPPTKVYGVLTGEEGFTEGEVIEIRLNGTPSEYTPVVVWHDDKVNHEVSISQWKPMIDSITPVSAKAGDEITLTGDHFYPSAPGEVLFSSNVIFFKPGWAFVMSAYFVESFSDDEIVLKLPIDVPAGEYDVFVTRGDRWNMALSNGVKLDVTSNTFKIFLPLVTR